MESFVQHVNINLTERLVEGVEGHIASLRNTLRSLEDDSYGERVNNRPFDARPVLQVSNLRNVADIARDEIRSTYLDVMRCLVDFIDLLIGVKELVSADIVLTRDVCGGEDLAEYIADDISLRTQFVGTRPRETGPKKIALLGTLSPFLTKAIEDYFAIRATLEHHKNVAQKCMTLSVYRAEFVVDGTTVIDRVPFDVDKGQTISLRMQESVRTISMGEEIILTETELEEVVLTILNFIAPQLMSSLAPEHK